MVNKFPILPKRIVKIEIEIPKYLNQEKASVIFSNEKLQIIVLNRPADIEVKNN